MFDFKQPLEYLHTLDQYRVPELVPYYPRLAKIKILFLTEGLQFDSADGFSFKLLIDLLRDNSGVSYANFEVTLASWAANPANPVQKDSTTGDYQATYSNYRFASNDPDSGELILDQYDEVWLFGLGPNTNFPVNAVSILASTMCPTNDDLIVLTRWMNAGGGVLAMGDHASLGANLCARIPRVWTMRRWTEEDGAPPRIGEDRVDTNQPMWPAQDPNMTSSPQEIPFEAQSDDEPQRIELKKYHTGSSFFTGWRPHPILCGGRLGHIDVLPDHPHEGWIKEPGDIDQNANVLIDNLPSDIDPKEYPSGSGRTPAPEVIAWGNTLADPPYVHEKGDSPGKRFGVIGAYDGHIATLGRVVVDSTWHHWMSINLSGQYEYLFDGDPDVPGNQDLVGLQEANASDYKKIVQYYRNVAVWLAPKSKQQQMLTYASFFTALSTHTFQEWRSDTPLMVLGKEGRDVIGRSISHCFISYWVFELVPPPYLDLIPDIGRPFGPDNPFDPECFSCPREDLVESLALGVLLCNTMKIRDELFSDKSKTKNLCQEDIEDKLVSLFEMSRQQVASMLIERLETEQKIIADALLQIKA